MGASKGADASITPTSAPIKANATLKKSRTAGSLSNPSTPIKTAKPPTSLLKDNFAIDTNPASRTRIKLFIRSKHTENTFPRLTRSETQRSEGRPLSFINGN